MVDENTACSRCFRLKLPAVLGLSSKKEPPNKVFQGLALGRSAAKDKWQDRILKISQTSTIPHHTVREHDPNSKRT